MCSFPLRPSCSFWTLKWSLPHQDAVVFHYQHLVYAKQLHMRVHANAKVIITSLLKHAHLWADHTFRWSLELTFGKTNSNQAPRAAAWFISGLLLVVSVNLLISFGPVSSGPSAGVREAICDQLGGSHALLLVHSSSFKFCWCLSPSWPLVKDRPKHIYFEYNQTYVHFIRVVLTRILVFTSHSHKVNLCVPTNRFFFGL